MNVVVDLPAELETELADEANHLGLPMAEYIVRVLATGRTLLPSPRTGAELIAYWQSEGLVGSRADITDAPEHARKLREQGEGGTSYFSTFFGLTSLEKQNVPFSFSFSFYVIWLP
jgi:hypothetical protein